jgi:MarR family transcriptional regulator, organic hydroperoxide resistance regulator
MGLATAGAEKSRRTRREAGPRAAELEALRAAFRQTLRSVIRLRGRDTHLAGSELSHAQFELLTELADRGPLPAGELAAAASLTPGTVTQMLDHLAASGHVERLRSQTDRRVVVTRLTRRGRRQIEAKREVAQQHWEEALAGLEPAELRAATKVFERVGAMIEASSAPPCEGAPQSAVTGPKAPAKRGAQASRE